MAQITKRIILLFLIFSTSYLSAQELNCVVRVNARQIEGSEKVIFDEMQKAIFQLVNGRKWTSDEFETHERIDCSILINLTERISANQFKGNIQVQASRPVFNTNFDTPLLNVKDVNFVVKYNQFEPLQYNQSGYSGELTSIIAYYVYMILAYDYDSYALEGGTKYFQVAQQIVNFAQSSSETGWRAFEDQNNRYWLVENALTARFKPLRKTYYNYHRNGFDIMDKNVGKARKQISQSLKELRVIHNVAPSSYNMQAFFNAKFQELMKLYGEATPQEKSEISQLLITIDPGHTNDYTKLGK